MKLHKPLKAEEEAKEMRQKGKQGKSERIDLPLLAGVLSLMMIRN